MNPFKYGCIVNGDFFCPRPVLERELRRLIESGQNVVVQGERRMGKTSLVREAVGQIRGERLIYIDLYYIRSLSDFCKRVMNGERSYGSSHKSSEAMATSRSRNRSSTYFHPLKSSLT